MNAHDIVLQKKEARLAKYTGKKLARKLAAFNKARTQGKLATPKDLLGLPAFQEEPIPAETSVTVLVSEVKYENFVPEWNVIFSDGETLTVQATSEKKARTAARDAKGLPRLPAGTKVLRIGEKND